MGKREPIVMQYILLNAILSTSLFVFYYFFIVKRIFTYEPVTTTRLIISLSMFSMVAVILFVRSLVRIRHVFRLTTLMFLLVSFGTYLFILEFRELVWIAESLRELVWIIVGSIITGLAASTFARYFTGYKKVALRMNPHLRSVINSVMYSFLVWVRFISFIFDRYEWMDIILWLLVIKFLVLFCSDYISDKMTFGG